MFMPIGKASNDEMKHLAARQTSLYFLLQVFKSSYNEKVRDSKQTPEVDDASATAVLEGGFV